jgi:hypothetical protein
LIRFWQNKADSVVQTGRGMKYDRRMMSLADPAGRALALLLIGTVLLPFQMWPPMHYLGMQLSDIVYLAALIQFVLAKPKLPQR